MRSIDRSTPRLITKALRDKMFGSPQAPPLASTTPGEDQACRRPLLSPPKARFSYFASRVLGLLTGRDRPPAREAPLQQQPHRSGPRRPNKSIGRPCLTLLGGFNTHPPCQISGLTVKARSSRRIPFAPQNGAPVLLAAGRRAGYSRQPLLPLPHLPPLGFGGRRTMTGRRPPPISTPCWPCWRRLGPLGRPLLVGRLADAE